MHIEPFGYFRAEPFGWTNCDKGDDGAMPLFDGAVIMDLQQQLATERASLFAESQRKQQLEQQVAELVGALKYCIKQIPEFSDVPGIAAVIQKVRGGE